LRTIVRLTLRNVHRARVFWRAFYFDAIAKLTKEQIVARYLLSADVDRQGPLTAEAIASWPGDVLILEGGADRIAHGDARSSLKAVFPRAVVRTFAGAGHAISAEHTHEWAAAIAGFLSAAPQ
jgi:pimeloyl-ACP methyl ester carboxylesterase